MSDSEVSEICSTTEPFSPLCSSYAPSESDTISISEDAETNASTSRKRIRKPEKWIRNVRKLARNTGKSYITKKGKMISAKKFNNFNCKCTKKCHTLLSLQQRKKIFKKYYELGNFDLQTSYICQQVQVKPCSRVYTKTPNSRRKNSRCYHFKNQFGVEVQVCKEFFLTTLDISNGRLSRAVKGIEKGSPPHKDQRGKSTPANKTSNEKLEEAEHFIQKFPTYSSHYGREKAGDRKYLSPDLNISIIYDLYKTELKMSIPDFVPLSRFIFRQIFNEKFNLHFHPPVTDSCRKCDAFEVTIKHAIDSEVRQKIELERLLHHKKAEVARNEMKRDAEEGRNVNNDVTVIALDLMKTLPTPVLSTGLCYYKRQLWTYCLGVHNLSSNEAFMYVWNESIASRGAQEIGSCLMHYIKNFVKTSSLIMYSDQCGGQNRNIKMYSFCNYIVTSSNFTVNKIEFLVSGHSYLPCDEDFGLIEKRKKFHSNIFVPDDWLLVIQQAKKKNLFIIVEMKSEDFVSSKQFEQRITNRKINTDKNKVQWLKIQWIQVLKQKPHIMRYKYSNNQDTYFYEVNLAKRNSKPLVEPLNKLFPSGRAIDKLKFKDLNDLLSFIPPVHHQFYRNLKSSEEIQDVGIFGLSEEDDF